MVVQSKAWEQVGKSFESLGAHLRSRLDEVGEDAAAERAAVEQSLHALVSALEEAAGATGKVVRDPVLRQDLNDLAASVRSALIVTFERAGGQVRERLAAQVRRGQSALPGNRATKREIAARKATPSKAAPRKAAPRKATPRKATPSKAAPSKAAPSKAAPSKAAPSKAAPNRRGGSRRA